MIRLIIDRVTNKIQGYEHLTDFLEIYSDDVIIDDSIVDREIIGSYYEDGEIVKDDFRIDYNSELRVLQEELFILNQKVQNKDEIITALLEDTFEEKKAEIQAAQNRIKELQEEISQIVSSHKEQLNALYLEDNKKLDATITPDYYSSVCLLIKDETQYLKEWIDHYLKVGFDHVYIYDNGSVSPVIDAVNGWYDEKILAKITVIDFTGSYVNLQTECYNDFLQNHGKETRWVLFADSDEFLRIISGENVNTFLQDKEDYSVIHIDFVEYGADGQEKYEDKPVQERFTTPVTVNDGIYYKDIIQPVRIACMRTHYPIYNRDKHMQFEKDKTTIVIDHYYTKSWEEWRQKIARGSCDPNYLKHLNEFFIYNPDMEYLKDKDNVQGYFAG